MRCSRWDWTTELTCFDWSGINLLGAGRPEFSRGPLDPARVGQPAPTKN